jgi:P27 family predicted phage terminase small subunit
VKPPPRCGRPTATGAACQRLAGWGTDAALGPCKSHVDLDRVDLAEPPAYLPDKAKELWRMLAPDLIATDRLRTEDLPAFEQMCMAYYFSLYSGALLVKEGIIKVDAKHKDEAGQPSSRKHPAGGVWRDAVGVLRQFACEFGLTPSSRSRLELPAGADDPQDPWSKF